MNILKLLNRETQLFEGDWNTHIEDLREIFMGSRILVVGGAGSIFRRTSHSQAKRTNNLSLRI